MGTSRFRYRFWNSVDQAGRYALNRINLQWTVGSKAKFYVSIFHHHTLLQSILVSS